MQRPAWSSFFTLPIERSGNTKGYPLTPKFSAGCARPLMHPLVTAEHIHSDPRLDAVLPEPAIPLQSQHGVDFLIETLRSAEAGTITVCALGPLTNIAYER